MLTHYPLADLGDATDQHADQGDEDEGADGGEENLDRGGPDGAEGAVQAEAQPGANPARD